MNLCLWTYELNTCGGVQREVSILSNQLSRYHNVTILTSIKTLSPFYELNKQIKIEKIPFEFDCHTSKSLFGRINKKSGILNNKFFSKILEKIYFKNVNKKEFVKYFNEKNYDLIIGVHCYNSLYLSIVANKLNAKTIGWQHNCFDAIFDLKNRYLYNMDYTFKKNIKQLNAYIVLTKSDKQKIDKMCGINSVVINNMTDLKSQPLFDKKEKKIISVGRFVQAKRFDILIESLSIVLKKHPDWRAVLVGDGPLKSKLIELIKKSNLTSKIQLTGFLNDVSHELSNSSIFVLSSQWEGMPLTVLEAFQCGLPVVSFDIEACKSLKFDNKAGILVKYQDGAFGLSKGINYLIENSNKRISFSSNAYNEAKKYSPIEICNKWNDLLFELFYEDFKRNSSILHETSHSIIKKSENYILKILKGNYINNYSFKRELESNVIVNKYSNINARKLIAFNEKNNMFIFYYINQSEDRPQKLTLNLLKRVLNELDKLVNIPFHESDYLKFLTRNETAILYFEKEYGKSIYKDILYEKNELCFVHGDISRSNLIFSNDKVYLIDFENSGCGLKKWDKCYFISSFLFEEIDETVLNSLSLFECKLVLLTLQVAIGRLIKHDDFYYRIRKDSYDKFVNYFNNHQAREGKLK